MGAIRQTTLRQLGFVLPSEPPKIGYTRPDGAPQWNAYSLKREVRDFLCPEDRGGPVSGKYAGEEVNRLINAAAVQHGHDHRPYGYTVMARDFSSLADPEAAARVAAWLGYSPAEIWPHRHDPKLKIVGNGPLPISARFRFAVSILLRGTI